MLSPQAHIGMLQVRQAVEIVVRCSACRAPLLTRSGKRLRCPRTVRAVSYGMGEGSSAVQIHIECPACAYKNVAEPAKWLTPAPTPAE
jgi:DNA-directed RNA polymerase subunit RPC12/RpoP